MENGILENKSGNISETHKDGGKVTMEGLLKLTNAVSNGTIPDPPMASPSSRLGVCNLATPSLSQERIKLRTSNLAGTFTGPIRIKAH